MYKLAWTNPDGTQGEFDIKRAWRRGTYTIEASNGNYIGNIETGRSWSRIMFVLGHWTRMLKGDGIDYTIREY